MTHELQGATRAMTIGTLARLGGVGVETIRFYQRRGLLDCPPRGTGSAAVRRYGADDLRRLRFIRSAQTAGFSLEEIGGLLQLDAQADRAQVRAVATARLAALDARIEELTNARAALGRLVDDCATGSGGPCPILSAFEG